VTELEFRPDDMTELTRDGKGKFTRDPRTAIRDGQAAALRARGLTYAAIGERLGYSAQSAHEAVQRALRDSVKDGGEAVRELELERLDYLYRRALDIAEKEHVAISNGRVVGRRTGEVDEDGEPIWEDVLDDGPELAAIKTLLQIQERRAKLLGLDSATKVDVSGGLKYELVGVDPGDV
jgi:hypothetical protein